MCTPCNGSLHDIFNRFDCCMVYAVYRSLIMAKIIIETSKGTIEYYKVPSRLAKALIQILDYAMNGTEIFSCASNPEDE